MLTAPQYRISFICVNPDAQEKKLMGISENTSRRAVLASIASAVVIPTTAMPAVPDPIFAAIYAYRQADAATDAVPTGVEDEFDRLMELRSEAYNAVLCTHPTTPAGLAALTGWVREQAGWLRDNHSVLHANGLCALTAAVDDATRGMSGLEPWTPPQLAITSAAPMLDRSPASSLARAEQVVTLLRTCYIREGWKIDDEAAEVALTYCRQYAADGSDPDEERMAAIDFFLSHGVSIDWVFGGAVGGLICRGAKHSQRADAIAGEGVA
jgi:hypothetical protein